MQRCVKCLGKFDFYMLVTVKVGDKIQKLCILCYVKKPGNGKAPK